MKYSYLILSLFFITSAFAQEVSEVAKLQTTAKIWGFLKYYHPEVASGKHDWDQQLLNILPKVKEAKTSDALSKVYVDWIASLGTVKKCKNCKHDDKNTFNKNFDLSWMSDPKTISSELTAILKNIEENRFQGKNFYVAPLPAGNINIINEKSYKDQEYPNEDYRLLGLFRYWNIVEYFYPYKYLLDNKWNDVLEQMIPKYTSAQNKAEYHLAIRELIAKVDDTHTWIHLEDRSSLKHFPYLIKDIDNNCVITGFLNDEICQKEGLQKGDIILKVNGKDFQQQVQQAMKYKPASNLNGKIYHCYLEMLNGVADNVSLTIKRGEETHDIVIKLYDFYKELKYYDNTLHKTWEILEDGKIGYVRMRLLDKRHKIIGNMMKEMMDTKAIILDLRGYPKTSFNELSEYLNSNEKTFAKIINPDLSYPGKFFYRTPLTTGKKNKNYYKGKVIILVDEQTFSLAEFAAMCLQTADNAITIGSQTTGADGNVSVFQYMGGFDTAFSGKGVYYPDGSETQRVGIKIDHLIRPTIQGLKANKDEVLEKAIELSLE